jgi:hypothetical protein
MSSIVPGVFVSEEAKADIGEHIKGLNSWDELDKFEHGLYNMKGGEYAFQDWFIELMRDRRADFMFRGLPQLIKPGKTKR